MDVRILLAGAYPAGRVFGEKSRES